MPAQGGCEQLQWRVPQCWWRPVTRVCSIRTVPAGLGVFRAHRNDHLVHSGPGNPVSRRHSVDEGIEIVRPRRLKRATPQNIVIGGAAGAAPPGGFIADHYCRLL